MQGLRTPDIYLYIILRFCRDVHTCRFDLRASHRTGSIKQRNSRICSNRLDELWYVGFVAIFQYQYYQLRIVWIIRWTWTMTMAYTKIGNIILGFTARSSVKSQHRDFRAHDVNANYRVSISLKAQWWNTGEILIYLTKD